MAANESLLVPRRERGWRMGLSNMLSKEMASWWRTRQWWAYSLAALVVLNLGMALNLRSGGAGNASQAFLITAGLFAPVAAVSLAQDSIFGERHSGTAAWVLSKPIRRPAYVLAKTLAHGLGLLTTWAALPFAVAFLQLHKYFGPQLSAPGLIGAMALHYLNLMFYMTLAMLLASIFNGRGPVTGICLLVAWSGPMQFLSQPIQKYAPRVREILPWRLMVDFSSRGPLAGYLALGQRLPTVVPIIATALWCVLFVAVTLWRMSREEF